MQIFSNFKYPLGCVFIILIIVNYWETISLKLFEPKAEQVIIPDKVQGPKNETISEKMNRKRKILERGCSMMAELNEMSQNGTSYEILLDWHAKIHDLDYPLRWVFKMMLRGYQTVIFLGRLFHFFYF